MDMLDIKWIRANPEQFDLALVRRGLEPMSETLIDLDIAVRDKKEEAQDLQAVRNTVSKDLAAVKKTNEDTKALVELAGDLKLMIPVVQTEAKHLEKRLNQLLSSIPNMPAEDVPDDSDGDKIISAYGHLADIDFEPRQHFEIGKALGMDFESAAKMSGTRFTVLRGELAQLERAIVSLMFQQADLHGYTEISPPLLVRPEAAFGTGQLPKFEEDLFMTTDGRVLIPTAEVPLTNLVADEVIKEEDLPLRFVAHTPCFRSEAGAAGKDTRGMIRQHQFNKVELVTIAHPDQAEEEHEKMLGAAANVLKVLDLPHRTVILNTDDLGFSATKTYDIEVYLAGQHTYREISSISNCGDFQARRMNARFKTKGKRGTQFVHTLNGSALAVGRTLVAILEHYQREDGSVEVPKALQFYMNGKTELKP